MLCEQPDHWKPSAVLPLMEWSQPQSSRAPEEHLRVMAWATPAEAMAWTNAASRVPEGKSGLKLSDTYINYSSHVKLINRWMIQFSSFHLSKVWTIFSNFLPRGTTGETNGESEGWAFLGFLLRSLLLLFRPGFLRRPFRSSPPVEK